MLSKIPVKYHEGLKNVVCFVVIILIFVGIVSCLSFTKTEMGIIRRIECLIVGIILIVLGIFLVWKFMQMSAQRVGRYKQYVAIIRGNDKLIIRQIADITKINENDVKNDLENMIDSGYIKDYYIDHQQHLLIDKSFVPTKVVKVECQCGAVNAISIGQMHYYKCISCHKPIILTYDDFYSVSSGSGTESTFQPRDPTMSIYPDPESEPTIDATPEPTPNNPSSGNGWVCAVGLGLAALALICFRRKD